MKLKLNEIFEKANDFFKLDLSCRTRKADNIIAIRVFFVYARKQGYTFSSIGDLCNRSHAMVFLANKKHDDNIKYDAFYREFYNDFVEYVEGEKEVVVIENVEYKNINSNIINILSTFDDQTQREFLEYKLKPFAKLVESRVKPKVFNHVAGAIIRR